MVLAVAVLLLQFQAVPAAKSSVTVSPSATPTFPVAQGASSVAPVAVKPDFISSETESSSTRLNVGSVELVGEDSTSATLRPVSLGASQNAQTFSTIRIPETKAPKENSIERAINSPSRKQWILLAAVEHGAAGFDAYSTRQAVGHGAVEEDPLMRPFAGSPAIYAATQVGPLVFDLLARHMQRSEYPLVRRLWWMPQTLSAGVSIFSGVHNLNVASGLQTAGARQR
jgi:hypothetical protein